MLYKMKDVIGRKGWGKEAVLTKSGLVLVRSSS